MLHPLIVRELLAAELAVAQNELGHRLSTISLDRETVTAEYVDNSGRTVAFQLRGDEYDAKPLKVIVLLNGQEMLPQESNGLIHSVHPVLHRGWVCAQGTYEYHAYPGHTADNWAAVRMTLRLVDLLDHLLKRVNR